MIRMVLTRDDLAAIEGVLRPHAKDPDQTLVDTLERLIRERSRHMYDESRAKNAIEGEQRMRRAFFAAIMSADDRTLKIDPRMIHMLEGPSKHEFELRESYDPALDVTRYRVVRHRGSSNYHTLFDVENETDQTVK